MPGQVILEDATVRFEGLTVANPDVIQYFKQKPEDRRPEAAVRAIELGVFCLQRAEVGQSLEFVRLELERLIQASRSAVDGLPEVLRSKLTAPDGPMAQVSSTVQSVQTAISGKLTEVQQLFEKHLDPRQTETTLGKALQELKNLLDASRDDSVQKRVESIIASIATTDGTLANAVKKAVQDVTAPLSTAIATLSLALERERGVQEVVAASPEKGYQFEEELLPLLRDWSVAVGADLEYTAPQNRPGDFVLTLRETGLGPSPLRIVVEARDRENAWGRVRINEQMSASLSEWNGNYGIYVSKTQDGLAQEIGEWRELDCDRGPVVACIADHLRTALRFALVDTKLRTAAQERREIDIATLSAQLDRFRDSLNHLTQIKRKATEIREILSVIDSVADQMREGIQDTLSKIEAAIPR
jgi:hypothetical protein